jgi:hypothetical protein
MKSLVVKRKMNSVGGTLFPCFFCCIGNKEVEAVLPEPGIHYTAAAKIQLVGSNVLPEIISEIDTLRVKNTKWQQR